jgi:hypothetical protein
MFIIISYYLRTSRNDIDGAKKRGIRFVWTVINSSIWNDILWIISVIYQIIVFWEPVNR